MIYIRADMNMQIATGHMMRCLSIADALSSMEKSVTFILADDKALSLLKQRGYYAIVLHTDWNNMEGELPALRKVITENQIDKMLIDSYQVTEKYLKELSRFVKIVYMDDLNEFDYPVDAIICYANYWKKFNYPIEQVEKHYFVGTKYVPLKSVFWNCGKKVIAEQPEKLLVLTGGSDPYHVSELILNCIDLYKFRNIDVICGMYNTDYRRLVKHYKKYVNIRFHQAVNNIEAYMQNADIAISAGGTTLYELCACGTPTISYSFADNQWYNVRQFEEDGVIDYAGDARVDYIVGNIMFYLEKYRADFQLRKSRSERMQKMVDGKGATRIAKILIYEE